MQPLKLRKIDGLTCSRQNTQLSGMSAHTCSRQTYALSTVAAAADYAYGLLKHERLRLQPLILHNIGGCARRCPSSQVTDAVQPPILCNIGGCTCGRQKDLLAAVLAAA